MKLQPLLLACVIGLFLYWVVQDPMGAADMLRVVFDWTMEMLQLIASRFVQFLNALV
jgi:hypothetical protein